MVMSTEVHLATRNLVVALLLVLDENEIVAVGPTSAQVRVFSCHRSDEVCTAQVLIETREGRGSDLGLSTAVDLVVPLDPSL